MTSFRKVVLGAALAAAVATPAFAQSQVGNGEPWELRDNMAYTVTPGGTMRVHPIGGHGMTMLMRHSKPVARGTVLFVHGGKLYMMQRGKAFDRTGNWMGGT